MKTLVQDRELIGRAANGCGGSFDTLVDRHYKGVYAHAYGILRNVDDAADATQITFVKAHRSIADFDKERPIKPWLYRICSNVCIDMARSRHRAAEPLEKHAYMLESDDRPEEAAERADLQRRIQAAIARLPERYRRIVMLRHFAQLDVEEIAETVGAPEGTIKSWLFRSRALLRGELSGVLEPRLGLEEATA